MNKDKQMYSPFNNTRATASSINKQTTLRQNAYTATTMMGMGASKVTRTAGGVLGSVSSRIMPKGLHGGVVTTGKALTGIGVMGLGATGMFGMAFMKGGMNQMHETMMDRYMKDSRFSNRLLTQARLGSSHANSPLSLGNHVGLSLAMHKTRHGG